MSDLIPHHSDRNAKSLTGALGNGAVCGSYFTMMLASRISCKPCKAAAIQAKRAPVPSRIVACRVAAAKEVKKEAKKEGRF